MLLQRSYSSPSCTLFVEGVSTSDDAVISLLTRFTCQFHGSGKEIAGGKQLLEMLIAGTGFYTQFLLDGEVQDFQSETIHITTEGENHHLQVKTEDDPNPVELQLDQVQLFDLLEILDQLCLDTQTLPDLQLGLPPLIVTSPPQPAWAPTILGVATVAIAALVLYWIPAPRSRVDTAGVPQKSTPVTPKPSPTPSKITDPEKLEALRLQLFDQVDGAWRQTPSFTIPLQYQVTVNSEGVILGYKPTRETVEALGLDATAQLQVYRDELPLEAFVRERINKEQFPETPIPTATPSLLPIAQFLVTFDPTTYQLTVELPPIGAP